MNTKTKLLSALIGAGIITVATLTYAARPWYPCNYRKPITTTKYECDEKPGHCENRVWNPTTETCDLVGGGGYTLLSGTYDWYSGKKACEDAKMDMVTLSDLGCTISGCSDYGAIREMLGIGPSDYGWVWTADSYSADESFGVGVLAGGEGVYNDSKTDGLGSVMCK